MSILGILDTLAVWKTLGAFGGEVPEGAYDRLFEELEQISPTVAEKARQALASEEFIAVLEKIAGEHESEKGK